MAAPGSVQIILYNSTTAAAVPSSANLTAGELAVNVADRKIYSKNGAGAVIQVTASPGANSDITSLSGLTTPLSSAQGGTGVTSSTGSGSNVLSTSPTLVTPNLGTPSTLVGTNITGTAAGLSIGGNAATASAMTNGTISGTRISPRVVASGTTTGTITPTGDTADVYTALGLTGTTTFAIPSGTPTNGQKLVLRIKDNATIRTLAWTTTAGGYRVIGTTLPTATTASKVIYVGCIYNSTDSYWDVVAVAQQA